MATATPEQNQSKRLGLDRKTMNTKNKKKQTNSSGAVSEKNDQWSEGGQGMEHELLGYDHLEWFCSINVNISRCDSW